MQYDQQERERKPNRIRARKLAASILKELGIVSKPIRLAPILKHLDLLGQQVSLTSYNIDNISAFIDFEDNTIYFENSHPTVRKRFSVAHEIGHYLMDHGGQHAGGALFLESNMPNEIEANMFASELLMPFAWLKEDVRAGGKVKDLAWKYWVSEDAMGWRLSKSDALLLPRV